MDLRKWEKKFIFIPPLIEMMSLTRLFNIVTILFLILFPSFISIWIELRKVIKKLSLELELIPSILKLRQIFIILVLKILVWVLLLSILMREFLNME